MKGSGLKLQRTHVLALSVLALAGAAFFVGTSDSSAVAVNDFSNAKIILPPECYFEGQHQVQIAGQGEFLVESDESLAAVADEKRIDRDGLSVLPIRLLGLAGRGYVEGVGETVYWLDKTRPVDGSMIRAKTRGVDLPGVHEMRFHLFLTTEALPGRTFRSINPAVMVNNDVQSIPPKPGSRYTLKRVVEFEDIDDPGIVAVRILSNRNQLVRSDVRSGPVQRTRPAHEG